MSRKKEYKLAVVGCGRIIGHHNRSIESIDGMEIIAFCDLVEEKARAYGKEFNAPFFTNYREMFKKLPEIDIVVVATPSGMHFEHSMEFLETYGKHVIIEKPTFMRIDDLNKAYNTAEKLGLHIFPVFQNRYNKAVERVKSAIINKELGEIRIMNVRLRWCRPQRYYDMALWRGTFSLDGGAMTNQGIHHIDLLRYLGGEVKEVNATMRTLGADIKVEDCAVATFCYDNKSVGSLEITTAARPDDFEASLSIVGSKGLAQLGGIAVNELQIFSPNPDECKIYSDDFSDLPKQGRAYGRGHKETYNDISKFLIDNIPYPIPRNDCLSTITLLNSFYKSDELGKWVKVDNNAQSSRLGKDDKSISDLYRT
jgi:predicted dehydrogenase